MLRKLEICILVTDISYFYFQVQSLSAVVTTRHAKYGNFDVIKEKVKCKEVLFKNEPIAVELLNS